MNSNDGRRPGRSSAYHEAGHAVAAVEFGMALEGATIGREWVEHEDSLFGVLGFTSTGDHITTSSKYCMYLFAGSVAAARYSKRALYDILRGSTDFKRAQPHLEHLRQVYPELDVEQYLIGRTRMLIRCFWCAVEDIASELLAHGSVSGKRVAEIVRSARSGEEVREYMAKHRAKVRPWPTTTK